MKKKITKFLESVLPGQLFDRDGEIINRRKLADKIYDSIPNIERLDLEPFQKWIPIQCSNCYFNEAYKIGCTFPLTSNKIKTEHEPPENCPNGYST